MNNNTADFVDLSESEVKRIVLTSVRMLRNDIDCLVIHLRDVDNRNEILAQWVVRLDQIGSWT